MTDDDDDVGAEIWAEMLLARLAMLPEEGSPHALP